MLRSASTTALRAVSVRASRRRCSSLTWNSEAVRSTRRTASRRACASSAHGDGVALGVSVEGEETGMSAGEFGADSETFTFGDVVTGDALVDGLGLVSVTVIVV